MKTKILIEVITDALLLSMAGSLLYLYIVGAWVEPNPLFFYPELIMLIGVFVLFFWRAIFYLGRYIAEWFAYGGK